MTLKQLLTDIAAMKHAPNANDLFSACQCSHCLRAEAAEKFLAEMKHGSANEHIGKHSMTKRDLRELCDASRAILKLMSDGQLHSATEIIAASGQREGLRRMRALRQSGHLITRRRISGREWGYKLAIN